MAHERKIGYDGTDFILGADFAKLPSVSGIVIESTPMSRPSPLFSAWRDAVNFHRLEDGVREMMERHMPLSRSLKKLSKASSKFILHKIRERTQLHKLFPPIMETMNEGQQMMLDPSLPELVEVHQEGRDQQGKRVAYECPKCGHGTALMAVSDGKKQPDPFRPLMNITLICCKCNTACGMKDAYVEKMSTEYEDNEIVTTEEIPLTFDNGSVMRFMSAHPEKIRGQSLDFLEIDDNEEGRPQ